MEAAQGNKNTPLAALPFATFVHFAPSEIQILLNTRP